MDGIAEKFVPLDNGMDVPGDKTTLQYDLNCPVVRRADGKNYGISWIPLGYYKTGRGSTRPWAMARLKEMIKLHGWRN